MPVKPLPPNPNLDLLESDANDLIRQHAARDLGVAQRIREFHPRFRRAGDDEIFASRPTLADAQLIIARERGFSDWAGLKRRIEKPAPADNRSLPHDERIEDPAFRRAVDLLDAGKVEGLRAHLETHPQLIRQRVLFEGGNYFRNPTLLEFIAENPVRRGVLPPNITEIAKVILDAGAKEEQAALSEALGLVSSGCVPRECGVQCALIDLLCWYGADPDSAMLAALAHGEFDAVEALIRNGARIDLPTAAALGRAEESRLLLESATSDERHRALALASQFGYAEIVRMLLDAGEDPNRYNPIGVHSHSTPLHQAAARGHEAVVRLLLERGARPEIKDTLWQGTAARWARHEGRTEIANYLESAERES